MKNRTWIIVALVGVIFILGGMTLVVTAAYRNSSDKVESYIEHAPQVKEDVKVESKKVEPKKDNRETFRADYMKGCLLEADMYEFCTCNYDYLCDKYGLSVMVAAGLDTESEESKAIIMDGVSHCFEYIK